MFRPEQTQSGQEEHAGACPESRRTRQCITGMPTLRCFVQVSYPLFCAGVVLCLFCGSLDFSLPVRLCQTSSVTIGQPAEYSILMQNSGKDNARFCFSDTQVRIATVLGRWGFCAGQGGLKIGAAPRTGGTQANRFSNNAAIHRIRKSD